MSLATSRCQVGVKESLRLGGPPPRPGPPAAGPAGGPGECDSLRFKPEPEVGTRSLRIRREETYKEGNQGSSSTFYHGTTVPLVPLAAAMYRRYRRYLRYRSSNKV